MITFSSNILNLIIANEIDFFALVKIVDEDNVNWKTVTSHHAIVILSDSTVYTADGTLLGLSPPQTSTNVNREQFKIQFADPAFLQTGAADFGLIGHRVTVRLGFLDINGVPYTNILDTALIYSGKVDSTSYLIKTEERGDSILQIVCSSPMSDLDLKKYIFLSRDFIRGRNQNDSSCDMIYGGSGTLQLKWGKG